MTIVEFGEKYATPQCQDKKNMCYVYIHTCNRNESLINKIKIKSNSSRVPYRYIKCTTKQWFGVARMSTLKSGKLNFLFE